MKDLYAAVATLSIVGDDPPAMACMRGNAVSKERSAPKEIADRRLQIMQIADIDRTSQKDIIAANIPVTTIPCGSNSTFLNPSRTASTFLMVVTTDSFLRRQEISDVISDLKLPSDELGKI